MSKQKRAFISSITGQEISYFEDLSHSKRYKLESLVMEAADFLVTLKDEVTRLLKKYWFYKYRLSLPYITLYSVYYLRYLFTEKLVLPRWQGLARLLMDRCGACGEHISERINGKFYCDVCNYES